LPFDVLYQGFSRLHNWPGLADTFQKIVKEEKRPIPLPLKSFSKPIFLLLQMAARNHSQTRYLAIEENFLLAAIHVAAMRDIPFADGILPDFPSDLPSVPPGWDFISCFIDGEC
jgi:hypothetical protein